VAREVYVNGAFVDASVACVSVFDRGFLFADAVYEVVAVIDGALVDFDAHQARLQRSLAELAIDYDPLENGLIDICRELRERNQLEEGLIYLQISRGVADRSFIQPSAVAPSVVLFTQAAALLAAPEAARGLRVMSCPDLRWHRRDIKTTQLLYSSLMKSQAIAAGFDDVLMLDGETVTEGSSSNAHILTHDGVLVTRPLSNDILHGITRAAVLDYAREQGLTVEERVFTLTEAQAAKEAFITSATAFVMPVVEIDGVPVGDGVVGPGVERMRALYIAESRRRMHA
jgi:D-alanine transaminase